jgi:hypothetical protein
MPITSKKNKSASVMARLLRKRGVTKNNNGTLYFPARQTFGPSRANALFRQAGVTPRNGNLFYNSNEKKTRRNYLQHEINLPPSVLRQLSNANRQELRVAKLDPDAYDEASKNILARVRASLRKVTPKLW